MYHLPLKPLIACLGPRLLRGGSTGRFAYESRYRTGYLHEAQWMVRPRRSTTVSIANPLRYFYLLVLRPAILPTAQVNTMPRSNTPIIVPTKLATEVYPAFKKSVLFRFCLNLCPHPYSGTIYKALRETAKPTGP